MLVTPIKSQGEVNYRRNCIKLTIILLGIIYQLLSVMRGYVYYAITIDKNWAMYMYVDLVLNKYDLNNVQIP